MFSKNSYSIGKILLVAAAIVLASSGLAGCGSSDSGNIAPTMSVVKVQSQEQSIVEPAEPTRTALPSNTRVVESTAIQGDIVDPTQPVVEAPIRTEAAPVKVKSQAVIDQPAVEVNDNDNDHDQDNKSAPEIKLVEAPVTAEIEVPVSNNPPTTDTTTTSPVPVPSNGNPPRPATDDPRLGSTPKGADTRPIDPGLPTK